MEGASFPSKEVMKRILVLIAALVLTLSLVSCGGSGTTAPQQEPQAGSTPETSTQDVSKTPDGLSEDGIGEDPSFGEGIGEVVALTPEEESYMMAQTTNSWLQLSESEKNDLVVLIGRTLEATNGYIVEDYDDLVSMLDFQLEKYYRNGVNESVLVSVRDILGIS